MKQTAKLRTFAEGLKKGYEHLSRERYVEAKEAFKPFVELMKKSGTPQIRLFHNYSITQLRTGDIEGYFKSYNVITEITPQSTEEKKLRAEADELFFTVMEEWLEKDDSQ